MSQSVEHCNISPSAWQCIVTAVVFLMSWLQLLHLIRERLNICSQIHLPAQSGNSSMLTRMRRGWVTQLWIFFVPDCFHINYTAPTDGEWHVLCVCFMCVCFLCRYTREAYLELAENIRHIVPGKPFPHPSNLSLLRGKGSHEEGQDWPPLFLPI